MIITSGKADTDARSSRSRRCRRVLRGSCLLLGMACSIAAGAVEFRITHGNAQGNINGTPLISTDPFSASFSGGILNHNHSLGSAEAEAGHDQLFSQVTLTRTGSPYGANGRPWVGVRYTLHDVIFYDIDEPGATGSTTVSASADYWTQAVNADIFGTEFVAGISFTGINKVTVDPITSTPVTGTVSSNNRGVNLNQAYSVSFYSHLEMGISGFDPSTTGSVQGVVDNFRFNTLEGIGWYSPSIPTATTPLTATLALFLAGMLALGCQLRWQRRRPGSP